MAAPTPAQSTLSENDRYVVRKVVIPVGGDADVTATKVLDISTFTSGATGTDFIIHEVIFSLDGFSVTLHGDATADVALLTLAGTGHFTFDGLGALVNNAGSGKTGDMNLTTSGLGAATETGFIIFKIKKV